MAEHQEKLIAKKRVPVRTLNKKLIIALACIVLVIFLAIIINALSTTPKISNSNIKAPTTPQNIQAALAPVNNLPSDYGAADQINNIMMRGVGGPAMQKLLNSLQTQQADLQQQLAALKQQGNTNPNNGQFSSQASSSAIFFAGGAPNPQNTQAAAAAAAAAAKPATTPTTPGGSTDSYAQQNMQGQKLDFLTSQPNKNIYNNNTVQYPASPYILQAGSVIPAVLQTTISTDLPGVITAIVSQDVFDSISGKYLLIPRGSRLIGEYNSTISYGQTQVQAKFTRLIRPDGSSIILPNQPGVNGVGTSGLSDEVNNHWGKIIGAGVLAALFNIPGIIATNQMTNNNSSSYNPNTGLYTTTQNLGSTAGASALQGVGQSASNVGNAIASKSLNIQPTLIINSGYQFSIMVTKDIVLPPYAAENTGPNS